MIGFIKGVLFQIDEDNVLVDCNGLGYIVNIYPALIGELPPIGQPVMLYTHLQVLDNEYKLYGFINNSELNLFKTLLGVSGIGARNALNILGTVKPEAFLSAVMSQDEKTLTAIPGIGKKTAQRLIFELKDKLGETLPALEAVAPQLGDVIEALEVMGFKRNEIVPVVSDLHKNNRLKGTTEENIKLVLQILSRG
ncbi:MAG TPA: Holliday junction branch migration protein RuvA [Syntrophomonadaceae bacterium]|nr:Holliday junction branch migration protein RuvA [Syntrophomonadaceae bacterium]HNX28585.1 Holliday junction branch migration protein RuvA [Syntrophomonadaceae bacterium]HPR93983.1 Holliday junction branch migration protein RuvA [Syntrophomonadaceae bacterium]